MLETCALPVDAIVEFLAEPDMCDPWVAALWELPGALEVGDASVKEPERLPEAAVAALAPVGANVDGPKQDVSLKTS